MANSTASLEDIMYEQLPGEPQSRSETPRRTLLSEEDVSWSWQRGKEDAIQPSPGVLSNPNQSERMSEVGSPEASSLRHSPRSTVKRQPSRTGARESRARRATWTCIYSTGHKTILHSDKRGIIQKFKLGVPIRDMRLLDPNLLTSETGKILVRDNAIVFSIEHVRMILKADVVIVPRKDFDHNPLSIYFNSLLEETVADFAQVMTLQETAARKSTELVDTDDYRSDDGSSSDHKHEVAPLPFELQVLEIAIKDVCQVANQLTKDLEAVAHPALDALTKSVTTSNLERVRKVKTRHQRLYARVQTIREELQRFLEDDEDMMKMCLTRKKELEFAAGTRGHGTLQEMGSVGNGRQSLSIPVPTPRQSTPFQAQGSPPWQGTDRSDSGALQQMQQEDESESQEAVENLLESYFMQIDSTHDRLDAIGEFIEDTEEYINIELDSSRNRLLRLEIVLTAATCGIAIFSLVAGILGENLVLPVTITKNLLGFVLVNLSTLAVCFLFFAGIMLYIRYRRLM